MEKVLEESSLARAGNARPSATLEALLVWPQGLEGQLQEDLPSNTLCTTSSRYLNVHWLRLRLLFKSSSEQWCLDGPGPGYRRSDRSFW